jgi:hypothetical protein
MRFGLFIKQEWFFANPNYTWSVDNGLSVEGKIQWCQWDSTKQRTHRHVEDASTTMWWHQHDNGNNTSAIKATVPAQRGQQRRQNYGKGTCATTATAPL